MSSILYAIGCIFLFVVCVLFCITVIYFIEFLIKTIRRKYGKRRKNLSAGNRM